MNSKTLIIVMLCPLFMLGQNPNIDKKREKIETEKIGFLTSHLNLTVEDAQKFWPIYNEYSNEKHAYFTKRLDHKRDFDNINSMSDSEIQDYINSHFVHDQEILDLNIRFHDRFKQVLSNRQIAKFYHAEKEFRSKLLRDLTRRNKR